MTLARHVLKSSILAAHAAVNRWAWLRLALGQVASPNGATHRGWPVGRSVVYIEKVFQEYLRASGLCARTLEGKRVLEIGPGDNLGVALKFLAAGAGSVISVDRFYSHRDAEKERRIYLALRATLASPEKTRFDAAVDLSGGIKLNPEKLRYLYGQGIEQMKSALGAASCDVAVSCAVIEEIDDTNVVFSGLDRLLRPGGIQIHVVDLGDYGTLSRFGYHPLEFCTIPDAVYRYASKFSRPNRLRVDYYRDKMIELGYDSTILITHICGKGELRPFKASLEPGIDFTGDDLTQIEAMRPRLLKRYRGLSGEDLLISGILLVARKR